MQKEDLFYFASEGVGEGHPDKMCDQVSDAILDACIKQDPKSKVALETATKGDLIVLLGEISHAGPHIDFEKVARDTVTEIGFDHFSKGIDGQNCTVTLKIAEQDSAIADAVHKEKKNEEDLGAGDQGLMFGYATDEFDKETLFPMSHQLANKLCEVMAIKRKNKEIPWLRPDCKTQVIMEYKKDGKQISPLRIYNILISTQHDEDVDNETIRNTLIEKVIKEVCPAEFLKDTEYIINPSGKFVVGGPDADAGLTGRKIIVDTYGGWSPHGGGAFSGKDPSKVDRSAAYYGRYVAKSLVANGLCHRALVQVSYAIGLADPLSIHVDSFHTAKEGLNDHDLARIVKNNFNFRPYNIIKELNLQRPIFRKTAHFGHFGRVDPDFTWETPKKDLKLD